MESSVIPYQIRERVKQLAPRSAAGAELVMLMHSYWQPSAHAEGGR